jgi:hypothetical protein
MVPQPTFVPFDELKEFELDPKAVDPTRFLVVGRNGFVLGRVKGMIASRDLGEIVYLVVATTPSNFREGRGEERLLPLAWVNLAPMRAQVQVPHLAPLAFRRLPIYQPGTALPAAIPFPRPTPEEVEFWDIV